MSFRPVMIAALTLTVATGAACKGAADTPAAETAAAPAPSLPATTPITAATDCTPLASGVVTLDRQDALPDFLNDNLDQPVALRFTVARPTPDEEQAGFGADIDDGRLLVTYSSGLGEGGWEALAPEGAYREQGGGWAVDGVFVVRSGGMHQGIISYALETPATPPAPACANGATL